MQYNPKKNCRPSNRSKNLLLFATLCIFYFNINHQNLLNGILHSKIYLVEYAEIARNKCFFPLEIFNEIELLENEFNTMPNYNNEMIWIVDNTVLGNVLSYNNSKDLRQQPKNIIICLFNYNKNLS